MYIHCTRPVTLSKPKDQERHQKIKMLNKSPIIYHQPYQAKRRNQTSPPSEAQQSVLSSAAEERTFSVGNQIVQPKQEGISDSNCEILFFLKYSNVLLQGVQY